jgi:CubicO group peptidase (beta-lactamase class C family)
MLESSRRVFVDALIAATVITTTGVAACSSRSDVRPTSATSHTTDTARVARVVTGLRPLVEAVGRPPVRWTLAERMAHYKVPGVSIAVIEGGRVAWARGFGVKAAGTSDSVNPTTLFQAASISKPVAATAMLRLVERGTLELDVDVNRYLKSWKVPENAFTATEKVTLRRIASHSAGLTVHGFPGYKTTDSVPTVVQVLDGAKPANTAPVRVDTTPGAIERYSGGGTTVMQQLLVDVSGTPFPALMQELVLGSAGMTHSTYEQPLPPARAADAARAHDRNAAVVPGGWHIYPEMAAAGLWTTPTDLAAWALAITDARAGRSTALLSQSTVTQMLTAQKGQIGLGPFVGGSGRAFYFGHGGANEGFHCDVVMFPELGVGAVVMTNGDGGPLLIREIQAALAAEYEWPDRGPKQVNVVSLDSTTALALAGEYRLRIGPGIPATVAWEDDRLMLRAPQIPTTELLPESDTSFVMATLGWRVTFARDASGRGTALTVSRDGAPPIEGVRTR